MTCQSGQASRKKNIGKKSGLSVQATQAHINMNHAAKKTTPVILAYR